MLRAGRTTPARGAQGEAKIVARALIHTQILPHIRQDIVRNRWRPGERLPELDLCAEFGVSRTPLRDVLRILEVEGLVRLQPHVGAVVTPMDPPDLSEKFELMTDLEQAAAMKLARLRPAKPLEDIQRLHAAMQSAAREGRTQPYFQLNDEFHRAIVLGSDNATRARIHEMLMLHVARARNRANQHEQLTEATARDHAPIVDSILEGREEAAGRAMREHLSEVAQAALLRVRALQPEG